MTYDEYLLNRVDSFLNEETDLVHALKARLEELISEKELDLKQNLQLKSGIKAIRSLINDSEGVQGLHLNGDLAPWDELEQGGRFEDWLGDFNIAENAINN